MVDLLKIIAYCVAAVLLGALLAPGLYAAGQWVLQQGLVPELRPFGFEKYLNRAVMVTALLGLWPLLRWLRVRRWRDLGLVRNRHKFWHGACGLVLGAGGLGLVAWLLLRFEQLEAHRGWAMRDWLGALLAAVAVGFLEEAFFRGAILGVLRRRLPMAGATVAMSLFFASLHFLRSDPTLGRVDDPHFWSGLILLPRLFWQFGRIELIAGTWLTLFLMSCLLAYTVWRTRSLAFCIGLHAGWVFALKLVTAVTHTSQPSIWVGQELRQGLAPVGLMLCTWGVVGFVLWVMDVRRERDLAGGPGRVNPPDAFVPAGHAGARVRPSLLAHRLRGWRSGR